MKPGLKPLLAVAALTAATPCISSCDGNGSQAQAFQDKKLEAEKQCEKETAEFRTSQARDIERDGGSPDGLMAQIRQALAEEGTPQNGACETLKMLKEAELRCQQTKILMGSNGWMNKILQDLSERTGRGFYCAGAEMRAGPNIGAATMGQSPTR